MHIKNFCKAIVGLFFFLPMNGSAQSVWKKVDSAFGPLPAGIHVFRSTTEIDGRPNIAYYVSVDLKNRGVRFEVDTTLNRRLKPQEYYERNGNPLVVVNTTFFSFATNRNLSTVIRNGKLVSWSPHVISGKGKDSADYFYVTGSAIGISRKRAADVTWLYADSSTRYARSFPHHPVFRKEAYPATGRQRYRYFRKSDNGRISSRKWKMDIAVGGGPVLIHDDTIRITNNEEFKFIGKAIHDRHPRTAMGYTSDGRLIILAVQGRTPGVAEGADLLHLATIMKELGCYEALNLDGGGSSCLLINGKQTITPSDKEGQRPVPAVFIVR